jgi:hypothetical protein
MSNPVMKLENGKHPHSAGLRNWPMARPHRSGPAAKSPCRPRPAVQWVRAPGTVIAPRSGATARLPAVVCPARCDGAARVSRRGSRRVRRT